MAARAASGILRRLDMSHIRFLHVMSEGLDPTVIDAQVVDSIVAVREEGVPFDLLALTPPRMYYRRRAYYRHRVEEIAARTGGRVEVVPHPRKANTIGAVFAAAVLALERWRPPVNRLVIHARGDWSAYYASLAQRIDRRIRYVFDARGDGEAEFRLEAREASLGPRALEVGVRRRREIRERASRHAEHVLAVSTVLRDRIQAAHGIDPARMTVVPCVADARKFYLDDAERENTRKELALEGRFVVIYAGRLVRWHYGAETCAVVRGILDADPAAFFQILTPDQDEARSLAAETLPEGRYAIRSAVHAEVPRFLRAADLAMLLRAPDPLNEVACPTKFAEYMLCGLPVLISAGIGDCSRFVEEQGAGAVLAAPDAARAVEAVARLRAEPDAARRARIARSAAPLSRQRFAGDVARLFLRIAEAP